MDNKLTEEIKQEIDRALKAQDNQVGKVAELLLGDEEDLTNKDLVEYGVVANTGAASNCRAIINAIRTGVVPGAPSIAEKVRISTGVVIRKNPNLSGNARSYLEDLRGRAEAVEIDPIASEKEFESIEQASEKLEREIGDLPGVYVYTHWSFERVTQKTDPDRYWFKVGNTKNESWARVKTQARQTGLPEDPLLKRVYQPKETTPSDLETTLSDLEKKFHDGLDAAGHSRSEGKMAGTEWFATNLDCLDGIALLLGCEIHKAGEVDDDSRA